MLLLNPVKSMRHIAESSPTPSLWPIDLCYFTTGENRIQSVPWSVKGLTGRLLGPSHLSLSVVDAGMQGNAPHGFKQLASHQERFSNGFAEGARYTADGDIPGGQRF